MVVELLKDDFLKKLENEREVRDTAMVFQSTRHPKAKSLSLLLVFILVSFNLLGKTCVSSK